MGRRARPTCIPAESAVAAGHQRAAVVAVGHDHHAVALDAVRHHVALEPPVAAAVREVPALALLGDLRTRRRTGPTPTGVTISSIVARESTRFDWPVERLLHFDQELREIGGRGPQAGRGLLGIHVPGLAHPRARAVVRARRLLLARGRQRLLVRAVGHAEWLEHRVARELGERLADRLHQRELLNHHARRPSTRSPSSAGARAAPAGRFDGGCAVEDLLHRRQRRVGARSRETRSRRPCPTCGSSGSAGVTGAPSCTRPPAASTTSGSCSCPDRA